MTTVDPSAFALANLRLSVTHDASPRFATYEQAVYRLGRLCEARNLAAHGFALGLFPAEPTQQWLRESGRVAERAFRSGWLKAEDRLRIPQYVETEDLLATWADLEVSPQMRIAHNRTLVVRSHIDSHYLLGKIAPRLLFDSDMEWSNCIDAARNFAMSQGAPGAESRESNSGEIIDWAHASSTVCIDALCLLGYLADNVVAPWPGLVDVYTFALRDKGLSWLKKYDYMEPAEFVQQAMHGVSRGESGDAGPFYGDICRDVLTSILEAWAATPSASMKDRPSAEWDALLPGATSFTGGLGVYKDSLRYGLSWMSLLWRLAPTDSRSIDRYRNAVSVALEYLQRVGLSDG